MSISLPGLLVWLPLLLSPLSLLSLPVPPQSNWQLVWSDEFNGPANSAPDTSKWTYDLGATGWGNNELENYTNSVENAHLDGNGNLVIRAVRTAAGGYTSARLKTQGKYAVTYGKIEARIKIPFGHGVWPAFWMLGSDFDIVGWPKCGEIDIMENIGGEPSVVHASLHGPGYSGSSPVTSTFTLPAGQLFSNDFHIFSVVRTPEGIEYFVDGVSYLKVSPATIPSGTAWVFTKPFFLLLNVAVGGNWPGSPDSTTQFPQELTVDYVRVYKAVTEPAIRADGVPNADTKLSLSLLKTPY
jgi:beta-glucanase (GH16 family)